MIYLEPQDDILRMRGRLAVLYREPAFAALQYAALMALVVSGGVAAIVSFERYAKSWIIFAVLTLAFITNFVLSIIRERFSPRRYRWLNGAARGRKVDFTLDDGGFRESISTQSAPLGEIAAYQIAERDNPSGGWTLVLSSQPIERHWSSIRLAFDHDTVGREEVRAWMHGHGIPEREQC